MSRRQANKPEALQAADLTAWRESLGWTQAELARWLGVSVRSVNAWEHGEREIPGPVCRLHALDARPEAVAVAPQAPDSGNRPLQWVERVASRHGVAQITVDEVIAAGLSATDDRERAVLWYGWAAQRSPAMRAEVFCAVEVACPGLLPAVQSFVRRPGETRAAHLARLRQHPRACGAKRLLWRERVRKWEGTAASYRLAQRRAGALLLLRLSEPEVDPHRR